MTDSKSHSHLDLDVLVERNINMETRADSVKQAQTLFLEKEGEHNVH